MFCTTNKIRLFNHEQQKRGPENQSLFRYVFNNKPFKQTTNIG